MAHIKQQLFTYCSISYGITWTIAFGIYGLFKKGELTEYELNLYHSLAAIGPTIAVLVTAYYNYGVKGLKKLLHKIKPRLPNKRVLWLILSPLLFFCFGSVGL